MLVLMKSEFKQKLGPKSEFGEAKALEGATSKVEGKDVLIDVALPAEMMDQGAKAAAEQLSKILKSL
jgi:hypothetical protein